jgi:hypothetical protein
MSLKKIKIKIKLLFVFFGWCISDIRVNYNNMKSRYILETDPELLELQTFVKELIKKEGK